MKVLRASMWVAAPYMGFNEAALVVLNQKDLRTPIEEARDTFRTPGVLVICDVFDVDDGLTIEASAREALRRRDLEREANMATLYHWNAQAMMLTNAGGMVINPEPAPLRADDIEYTLGQLAEHPDRKRHTVISTSGPDNVKVTLTGLDQIERMPL